MTFKQNLQFLFFKLDWKGENILPWPVFWLMAAICFVVNTLVAAGILFFLVTVVLSIAFTFWQALVITLGAVFFFKFIGAIS